jgi:uncharacterized membrane protein YfcA
MLAMLLMAALFPPRESTGVILPMLITADIFAVRSFHAHAVWKHILRLLPPSIAGVLTGWLFMPHIPDALFGRVLGAVILAMVGMLIVFKISPHFRNLALGSRKVALAAGFGTGLTTMLANAAGPIATLYLLACRLPKMEFVGTAAWFFLIINVFKIPFSASLGLIHSGTLLLNLVTVPAVALGIFSGRWLLGKISQSLFEWLLLAFAALGALRLIL